MGNVDIKALIKATDVCNMCVTTQYSCDFCSGVTHMLHTSVALIKAFISTLSIYTLIISSFSPLDDVKIISPIGVLFMVINHLSHYSMQLDDLIPFYKLDQPHTLILTNFVPEYQYFFPKLAVLNK